MQSHNVAKSLDSYKHEKIIIRQVGEQINATIDTNMGVTTQSVYCLYPKNKDEQTHLGALLGILNSRLFDFFYRLVSGDKQMFKRIILENIKALPYPNIQDNHISQIEKLVDEILSAKQSYSEEDTLSQERQIDRLVYQLYGLTYGEVLIIDPRPPFTREEYEE